ncbi:Methyltransferase-like protein 2-A [Chamberlinius hualienensis]
MEEDLDNTTKRPQFGNRHLTDKTQIFQHNAWDNVVWDEELENEAKQKVKKNSEEFIKTEMQELYETDANRFWDEFYEVHQSKFFKDRHWLFTEFPELAPNYTECPISVNVLPKNQFPDKAANLETNSQSGTATTTDVEPFPGCQSKLRILEIGCGVGNTVFPILETNNDSGIFVYCCDFSKTALDMVKENPQYDSKRCLAFYCDVSSDELQMPFPENSLDIVVLIFVLSAIHPDKMAKVVERIYNYLKPGGLILFRDYGLYDLAQLRFKKGHCLTDNFYVRGDGTRVYFFTQEEIRQIFESNGFKEEQNLVDRRLQVNRGKQLKMYRVWIQCKYRKPNPS